MRKMQIILMIFMLAMAVIAGQAEAKIIIPGWGVQIYLNGEPWGNLVATAFHFSPDGSFYEGLDEGFQLKISTTFSVLSPITRHQIPIDASCGVTVFLDGVIVSQVANTHIFVELPELEVGQHHLEIINACGGESSNWMALVVGKCLWGTNYNNIKFVEAQ
jgi:hypothetical protein